MSKAVNQDADNNHDSAKEFTEIVVSVNRVTSVTKGGRKFRFAVLVVVGDGKGRVGYGLGKAKEVMEAKVKATQAAKKALVKVNLREGRTLHHDMIGHFGAGKVVLRSARPGTGIIAGGPMRAIFEALNVHDVVAKSTGSSNVYNMVAATFDALVKLSAPRMIAEKRGKKVSEIVEKRES